MRVYILRANLLVNQDKAQSETMHRPVWVFYEKIN